MTPLQVWCANLAWAESTILALTRSGKPCFVPTFEHQPWQAAQTAIDKTALFRYRSTIHGPFGSLLNGLRFSTRILPRRAERELSSLIEEVNGWPKSSYLHRSPASA